MGSTRKSVPISTIRHATYAIGTFALLMGLIVVPSAWGSGKDADPAMVSQGALTVTTTVDKGEIANPQVGDTLTYVVEARYDGGLMPASPAGGGDDLAEQDEPGQPISLTELSLEKPSGTTLVSLSTPGGEVDVTGGAAPDPIGTLMPGDVARATFSYTLTSNDMASGSVEASGYARSTYILPSSRKDGFTGKFALGVITFVTNATSLAQGNPSDDGSLITSARSSVSTELTNVVGKPDVSVSPVSATGSAPIATTKAELADTGDPVVTIIQGIIVVLIVVIVIMFFMRKRH